MGVLVVAYLALYLGVGLMILRWLRKVTRVGIFLAVLIQVMLFILGVMVPYTVQLMRSQWYGNDYSWLQITNPFWTLIEVGKTSMGTSDRLALTLLVSTMALLVFVLNLRAVAREVRQVRIARPMRVAEEDAALAAKKRPPQPVHTSPWD